MKWSTRMKHALLLGAGMTLAVGAGGCLPQNFYADLAGQALSGLVASLVDAFAQQLLATGA